MIKYGFFSDDLFNALKRYQKGLNISDEELAVLRSWKFIQGDSLTEEAKEAIKKYEHFFGSTEKQLE